MNPNRCNLITHPRLISSVGTCAVHLDCHISVERIEVPVDSLCQDSSMRAVGKLGAGCMDCVQRDRIKGENAEKPAPKQDQPDPLSPAHESSLSIREQLQLPKPTTKKNSYSDTKRPTTCAGPPAKINLQPISPTIRITRSKIRQNSLMNMSSTP